MISDEKRRDLVRQDICSRLAQKDVLVCLNPSFPLRIKNYEKETDRLVTVDENNCGYGFKIYKYKPYLRAIESMTREEKESTLKMTDTEYFDWLCRKNFDYRGLIPLGLAVKITKENNPYEKSNS